MTINHKYFCESQFMCGTNTLFLETRDSYGPNAWNTTENRIAHNVITHHGNSKKYRRTIKTSATNTASANDTEEET